MVRTAHGLLPNPSPAVVRLLEDVPTYGRDTTVELTTPTGAALLATMAVSFGPLPPMAVRSSGFGAGSHELDDLPNCTQSCASPPWPTTSEACCSAAPGASACARAAANGGRHAGR